MLWQKGNLVFNQEFMNNKTNSIKNVSRKAAQGILTLTLLSSLSFVFPQSNAQQAYAKTATDEVVISQSDIGGDSYAVCKQLIKAPADQIWQILSDYDNAYRIFGMVKACKVLEDNGSEKIISHTVAPSGPVGTFTYTLKVKEKGPYYMEWTRIKGAFKQVKGYWKLEPQDGGRSTLVTYASFVDGGMFIPKPLIKRQCRIDMPNVMTTLKSEVETKVRIAKRPGHSIQ